MKTVLIIMFALLGAGIWAQTQGLSIQFISAESKDSIYDARIEITQQSKIQTGRTNKGGFVRFVIQSDSAVKVRFLHGFYGEYEQTIDPRQLPSRENTVHAVIYIYKKTLNLKEIRVLAPGSPETVYQSGQLSVSDFEFLPNGNLALLLYPKTLKKGGEIGILSGNEIISRFNVPEKPLELIRDFRKNPHVVCEKGIYGIVQTDSLITLATHERNYFMKYIFPIVDTSYSRYYFTTFSPVYPAFDYQIFDQQDSSYLKIIEIKDALMMELYRSEFKWVDVRTKLWAKNLELETGIDKEIWVGANYFTQSIYYKELYAPMFSRHDSIFIFDYYRDKLFTFDREGHALDSVGIYHHYQPRQTGWKRQVIQDVENGKIYAFYEKDGICSLREINTNDGLLGNPIVFTHRYIDKIAVKDGFAYYVYRPFESAQKRFLYRTRLP